jgi:outer membrane protein assembly factor BamA
MTVALLVLALLAAEPQGPHFEPAILPAVDYNSDYGVGLGAIGQLDWVDPARSVYVYELQAQVFFTTGGQQDHYISIDVPSVLGSPYWIQAQVSFDRSRYAPWYGAGNHPAIDPSAPAHYYQYDRMAPNGRVQVRRRMNSWLQILAQYQFTWDRITQYPGSLLEAQLPTGSAGGRYGELFLGLIVDTRDNVKNPTEGVFAELALRGAHPILGSEYATSGLYAAVSIFHHPWERVVFAGRLAFEQAWGDIPFDHLQDIGVSDPQEGLGGENTVRGLLQSEFVGETKLLVNLEARVHLVEFAILGQEFKLGVLGFLDSGRVWSKDVPDPRGLNIHAGAGGGLRLIWGKFATIRADCGASASGVRFYVDLNQVF